MCIHVPVKMKATFHKSCSCFICRRTRGTKSGQAIQNANERKLRRKSKLALKRVVEGTDEDAVVAPIGEPYTS
jgi:hypothetical protein